MTTKTKIAVGVALLVVIVCWRMIAGDLGRRPVIMLVPTQAEAPIVLAPDVLPAETAELLRSQALQSDVILWGE